MPITQSDKLKTYLGTAAPMVLHASKNPIAADADSLDLDTIVEADFLGYAAIPLTDFETTENLEDDIGDVLTEPLAFYASEDLVTPQTIFFFYVTMHPVGDPVELAYVLELPTPILVNEPNQPVECQVRVNSVGIV